MKSMWLKTLLFTFVALSAGCFDGKKERSTEGQTAVETGSLQVWLGLQQGLTSAELATDVVLKVSGEGIEEPLEYVLTSLNEPGAPSWGGTVEEIPVGTGRTFEAQILDLEGNVRFVGTATDVTIVADKRAVVYIVAQEATPSQQFENTVPFLRTVLVSDEDVALGETVELRADADDADGDALTYAWAVNGGSLASPGAPTTAWTAPELAGTVKVTVTVSDSRGAAVQFSFNVQVGDATNGNGSGNGNGTPTGGADVTVIIAPSPKLAGIEVNQSINQDGSSTVTLKGNVEQNAEGGALTYQWSSTCDLAFTSARAEATQTTLPATLPGGTCTISLLVTNEKGGKATGFVVFKTGEGARVVRAPVVDYQCAKPASATPGTTVELCVSAHDPNNAALAVSWLKPTLGALESVSEYDVKTKSATAKWKLPACVAKSQTETAFFLVKNEFALTTVGRFNVDVKANCSTSCTPEGTCAQ